MKRRLVNRRQLLHGLGGFTLGLPFLPSLLPRPADAQDATFQAPPRLFAMATNHGGIDESFMFPVEGDFTEEKTLYPGHRIRRGKLVRRVVGGQASVTPLLRAPESELTDALVAKMNVLWGLDIPFYIAHHTGGHLGNYARNDGNGDDGQSVQHQHMPTIDQLLAWSPAFYRHLHGVTLRSMHCGGIRQLSWGFSSPQAASGTIQEMENMGDARELFDRVFPTPGEASDSRRPPVVDRVLEAYKSLRQSNRRMSTEDRQRLEGHMARLAELERRITTTATCESPPEPGPYADEFERYEQMLDVIAAAFVCGNSRVAVMGVREAGLTAYDGDWHQDIAHQHPLAEPQRRLREVNTSAFREVLLGLARRLDVEEAPGQTVLDHSLLAWSQESGAVTHDARSIPLVTFGGAGGRLRTGQACDYRNRTSRGMRQSYGEPAGYSGLLYNQWLASCLRAMGLSPADWSRVPHLGRAGYGLGLIDDTYAPTHVAGVVDNADQMLPFLGP